ncbi:morphogenic membrane protein MmpB [Streptomyces sp. NPDC015232]
MLWSDPEDEPPKDMREMQAMLQRAGVLIGVALVVWMLVIGARLTG